MKKFFKKVFVYLSVIAIVVQSLSPIAYLQLTSKAYAQTPTPDATVTPTPEVTPTPTPVPESNSVDATPSPTPTDIPTETLTPTPTDTPTPTGTTPVDNLSPPLTDNPSPSAEQVQGDSASPTPTPSVTPSSSPEPATGDEQLSLVILDNVSAPSIDLEAVEQSGSATLTTDKADYAPTDTALITGSNLLPNTTYTLRVWSDDEPATSITVDVTSDENGVFAYAYQLDGTYRPNYSAELKDSSGTVVATVTFTDSDPENVSTLAELLTALADSSITTINITANISGITETVVVGRAVTINGGGSTLTFTGLETATFDDGLTIQAPATINNLVVNAGLAVPTTWAGTYAIHVYNTTATLNNVTATNGNGGILVNGSTIELTGTTTVSENGFGGIEVSKGAAIGLSNSALTVTGTLVNSTEAYGKPTIWLINGQGTVTGTNVPTTTSTTIVTGQTQYYLTAGNAINPAIVCITDVQGANDQPGQKDLTQMCYDYSGLSTSITTNWNWDDTAWSGNNTGDACALFDTDGDGFANYATCVTVEDGPPAVQKSGSPRVFTCNDTRSDRCAGDILIAGSYTTNCSVTQQATQPFTAGDSTPNDTVAACTIYMSEVGGGTAQLVDVCSFPSDEPNSDPSDCIKAAARTGKLEVVKDLLPSNDSGLFNLQIDASTVTANVGDGGTTGEQIVSIGNYTVGETAGTDTSLSNYNTSIVCKDLNGTGSTVASSSNAGPLTVNIADGTDVVCTITNTRINNGSITIVKDAVPNDAQDFAFTTTGTGLSNFSLDDDGETTILSNTKVFSSLSVGTYSISEGAVTGWTSDGGVCSDESPVSAIDLSAGENVTCTFTNTKDATVVVQKNTTGGDGTFGFTSTGGNGLPAGFNVSTTTGSGSQTYTVTPGVAYSVSETVPSGWDLTSSSCTSGTPAGFTPTAGQTVTCTFNNTKKGHVIIEKNAIPDSSQVFTFNNNFGNSNPATFNLTDDSTSGLPSYDAEVLPGTYSVSEDEVTGWQSPESTSCTDGSLVSAINISPGETVTCTFVNEKLATIVLVKDTIGGNDTFDFDATGTGLPTDIDLTTIGSTANQTFNNLDPDNTYSIAENVTSGWDLTSSSCTGTNTPDSITPNADETVTCTFTNTKRGSITIIKNTTGGDDTFNYTSNFGVSSLTTSGGTTSQTVNNLVSGSDYNISETVPAGWDLNSATCTNGTTDAITVVAGQTTTCTFSNTKKGHLIVHKVTNPQSDTSTQFSVTATGSGVISGNATQAITGGSTVNYEVTPGTYFVSEADVTGWDETGNNCSNIAVAAGETKECTITNTQQGNVTVTKFHDHNANGVKDGSGDEVLSDWDITLSGNTETTDNNGQVVFGSLVPDAYTLSEDIQDNWFQSNISCTGDIGIDNDNSHPVSLAAGQNLTCEIGNYQRGHVRVIKHIVDPDEQELFDNSTEFTFNVSATGTNSAVLGDDENYTFDVNPGLNTVEEITDPDYDFVGCTGGIDGLTFNGEVVVVGSGETVEVICTNKQQTATITVVKDVVKSDLSAVDDNHLFHVTLNGETENLSEETDAEFTVNPGTYGASESADANYTLVSNDSPKTVGSNGSATINIVNKQNPGTISGTKFDENQNVLSGWTIDLYLCTGLGIGCGALPLFTRFTGTDGSYTFSNLLSGFYTVAEGMEIGWTYVTDWFHNLTVGPGDNITDQNFTNKGNLSITACKLEDSNGPLQGGNFTPVNNWTFALGTTVQSTGANSNCTIFTDLKPGTYDVSELPLPAGWFVADDSQGTRRVVLTNGNQNVNFFNYRKGHIIVDKVTDPSASNQSFDFTTAGIGYNGFSLTDQATPNDQELVPGTYSVAETVPAGWTQTSAVCDNQQTPENINLDAGQTVTCTFTNTKKPTLSIYKVCDPAGDTGLFNLQIDGVNQTTATICGGWTNGAIEVTIGSHTVSETGSSGTNLSNYTSVISGNCAPDGTVSLAAGENKSCTITNTRNTGSVKVHKQVDTDGNGSFEVNTNVGANALGFNWNLDTLGTNDFGITVNNVNTGIPHYINENDVPDYHFVGWYLTLDDDKSCSNNPNTSRPAPITVNTNQTTEITLCNAIDTGTVVVHKQVDNNGNGEYVLADNGIFEWTLDGGTKTMGNAESSVPVGLHSVDENSVPDYHPVGWYPTGEEDGDDVPYSCDNPESTSLPISVDVALNEISDITICNARDTGTIIVTKYQDNDGDGVRDEDESTLEGWNMHLSQGEPFSDNQTTDVLGNATFNNVPTGSYTLSEPERDGWTLTNINCSNDLQEDEGGEGTVIDNDNDHPVSVSAGETVTCEVGNHQTTPILTISKVNDAVGNKAPGDVVGFTITVRVSEEEGGPAENVKVTDLLPSGFVYNSGSWTASSNLLGALNVPEPTYASPGVWNLVDTTNSNTPYVFQPGDIITLKYTAKIDGSQATGTYYDNAWGQGTAVGNSDIIFAVALGDGDLDTSDPASEFVGTQVSIINPNQAGVDYKVTSTQEVLGASTFLPATGENTLWVIIATLLSILGLGTLIAGLRLRRKYVE